MPVGRFRQPGGTRIEHISFRSSVMMIMYLAKTYIKKKLTEAMLDAGKEPDFKSKGRE
jgi:hypothetical protein